MRKGMKMASIGMAAACLATAFSAVGCKAKSEVIKDGKTVNVCLMTAGYGVNYIYEIKEKFEAAFASEGYKLNILSPRAGYSGNIIAQDISTGSEVDVFFSGGFTEELLAEYPNILTDITDTVFKQKPLNFQGQEEGELTIEEKLNLNNFPYGYYKHADGTFYALPYQKGIRGLAVNTAVLDEYGLSLPRTSKEFFNCYDVIMAQAAETGIFPITQIATSNNYPCSFTNCWLAQYEGYDWYKQFISFQKADGTNLTKDEAVAMFDADGIEYMMTNMYRALDPNCSTYGSSSQGLEKAQAKIMNGSCAFMMNGDWMLQETYASFADKQRNNITFIRVPMISELGIKVFKDKYGVTEEVCENILCAIIDEVDKNTNLTDIKTAVDAKLSMNIELSDIETIAEARGLTYVETVSSGAVINANSPVKDIAALLLRMCASEEGAQVFAEHMYSANPYTFTYEENRYEWVNSSRSIMSNQYFHGIRPTATGYRATKHIDFNELFPRTGLYVHLAMIAENVTIYNQETLTKTGNVQAYSTATQAMQKLNYNAVLNDYEW